MDGTVNVFNCSCNVYMLHQTLTFQKSKGSSDFPNMGPLNELKASKDKKLWAITHEF